MVAALGFEALTASQRIPAQQHSETAGATKQNSQPSHAKINEPRSSEQTGQRAEKQVQATKHLKEFSIEFFNLKLSDAIIAIFTIVLAVKTAGLFKETAGLRAAADKQAVDTAASIAVAKRSADVAERALTELERPYLFIIDFNWILIDKAKSLGLPFGLSYSVANGGKLPAFIRQVKVGLRFGRTIPSRKKSHPYITC